MQNKENNKSRPSRTQRVRLYQLPVSGYEMMCEV